jgi:hypothetical protein
MQLSAGQNAKKSPHRPPRCGAYQLDRRSAIAPRSSSRSTSTTAPKAADTGGTPRLENRAHPWTPRPLGAENSMNESTGSCRGVRTRWFARIFAGGGAPVAAGRQREGAASRLAEQPAPGLRPLSKAQRLLAATATLTSNPERRVDRLQRLLGCASSLVPPLAAFLIHALD